MKFASVDRTVATPTAAFSRTISPCVAVIAARAASVAPSSYTTTYSLVASRGLLLVLGLGRAGDRGRERDNEQRYER